MSSEWSSPYSGDPPESLRPFVDAIVALVRTIPTPQPVEGSFPVPDRSRIISIFGARGTGKSTLMQFAARALQEQPSTLVLPMTDPESFTAGDSLAGWVLAQLEHVMRVADRAHELGPDGRSVEQLLEDLRRAQAARGSGYVQGLEQSGLSFDDFARDAVKLPAHGVRATERVAKLFDGLAAARQQPDLRVVLPVDDADLFPELLPGIVRDAQLLSASPRVVLLFAADRTALGQALQIAFLSAHGQGVTTALAHRLLDPSDVRSTVARQFVKHFPRSHRINLATLGPERRLGFTPITGDRRRTLLDLLSSLVIPHDPDRSLAELFLIRDTNGRKLSISPYAHSLSNNVRDVRQLHEALGAIDPARSDAASQGMWTLLRHGLDALEPELPPRALQSIVIDNANEPPSLRFDFTDIVIGKSMGGGVSVFVRPPEAQKALDGDAQADDEVPEPDSDQDVAQPVKWPEGEPMSRVVSLRRVLKHYAALTSEAHDAADGPEDLDKVAREDMARELPEQYPYLAMLAWEVTQAADSEHSLIDLEGHIQRLTVPGGSSSSDVVVGPVSRIAWVYWTLPDWEQASDVFACQHGWNCFIRAIAAPGRAPQTGEWVELALLAHLALVCSVQRHRAVPAWIADLRHDDLEEYRDADRWRLRRSELQAAVEEDLRATVADAEAATTMRNADYLDWVVSWLPLMATPLLTTELMSDWVLGLWRELAPERTRRSAANLIARQAREHMGGELADGDIALLARLDPEDATLSERAKSLRDVRAGLRSRHAQRQQELLGILRARGVDETTAEALRRDGATPEIVQTLRIAGIRPSELPTLAEAFPPSGPSTPDDPSPGPLLQ